MEEETFSKETLRRTAQLCRLKLSPEEEEAYLKQIQRIIEYVAELGEVDTEGVSPCAHVVEGMTNEMREDEEGILLSREEYLKNAPDQIGGMIRIPAIFDEAT